VDVSCYQGKAFTYLTIMYLMSNDSRFRITNDNADNLDLAAKIVVGKAKEAILKNYIMYGDLKEKH